MGPLHVSDFVVANGEIALPTSTRMPGATFLPLRILAACRRSERVGTASDENHIDRMAETPRIGIDMPGFVP